MSELLGLGPDLPWWAGALMIIGIIALVGVFGALFLPDWPSPDFTMGFDADPQSDEFVPAVATFTGPPTAGARRPDFWRTTPASRQSPRCSTTRSGSSAA